MKFLFDFLDKQAALLNVVENEILHTWKNNWWDIVMFHLVYLWFFMCIWIKIWYADIIAFKV